MEFHCPFCEAYMMQRQRQGLGDHSDHDILVQVQKDVEWLKVGFSNHLAHHQKLNYILATAACSGMGSLITGLILLFIKTKGA